MWGPLLQKKFLKRRFLAPLDTVCPKSGSGGFGIGGSASVLVMHIKPSFRPRTPERRRLSITHEKNFMRLAKVKVVSLFGWPSSGGRRPAPAEQTNATHGVTSMS